MRFRNPYQRIKTHTNYTDKEILDMITKADKRHNRYLYDYLIDRLYFYRPGKRNTKESFEYSILTARQERDRQNREKPITEYI